jgi:hypothetical protein
MKYALEIDSDAMIYIPSFVNSGVGIQQLMWGYTASSSHAPLCINGFAAFVDLVRFFSFGIHTQ